MRQAAVELKQVVYKYPQGAFTLRVEQLALFAGEIVFLLGENGSGKSTLAKLLVGIHKPREGRIYLAGTAADSLSLGQVGQRIGYLWQKPEQQLFAHSVLEELLFVDKLKNPRQSPEKNAKAEEEARNWLKYFQIEHLAERSSFFLSRGEKQRLALAAVLSQGAKYLVLDEPTGGLDRERKEALARFLTQLKKESGIGMTIISHDKSFTHALADRIVTLAAGEIIDEAKTLN